MGNTTVSHCINGKVISIGSRLHVYLSSKLGTVSECRIDYYDGYDNEIEMAKLNPMYKGMAYKRVVSLAEVEKIVELSNKEFDELAADLMAFDSVSKFGLGAGGTKSDYVIKNDSKEEFEKFRSKDNNHCDLITFVTSKHRTAFFVNADGYTYARNAGVYFE